MADKRISNSNGIGSGIGSGSGSGSGGGSGKKAASITCRVCGCLNFSSDAVCDNCQRSTSGAGGARDADGSASAAAASGARGTGVQALFAAQRAVAASLGRSSTPTSSNAPWPMRDPPKSAGGRSGQETSSNGNSNSRGRQQSNGNGGGSSSSNSIGGGQRINPPGSAVLQANGVAIPAAVTTAAKKAISSTSHKRSFFATQGPGNKYPRYSRPQVARESAPSATTTSRPPFSKPASVPRAATPTAATTPEPPIATTSSTSSKPTIAGKRSRVDRSREVIDLISSDEDSVDVEDVSDDTGDNAVEGIDATHAEKSTEALRSKSDAPNALGVAAKSDDMSRLALKSIELTKEEGKSSDEEEDSGEIRQGVPWQGRRFPHVEFNASDFPGSVTETLPHKVNVIALRAEVPADRTDVTVVSPISGDGTAQARSVESSTARRVVQEPTSLTRPMQPTRGTDPIVIDDADDVDDDDNDDLMTPEEARAVLFLSRRFSSQAFNPRDFMTMNDGLNIARRTIASAATGIVMPAAPIDVDASNSPEQDTTTAEHGVNNATIEISVPTTAVPTDEVKPERPELPVNREQVVKPEPTPDARLQPNTLIPRKKHADMSHSEPSPESIPPLHSSISSPSTGQLHSNNRPSAKKIVRVIKPALNYLRPDFMEFMRECLDNNEEDDVDEDDERAQLLEIIDLTNLTDQSADEDDDDDEFSIIDPIASAEASQGPSAVSPGVEKSGAVGSEGAKIEPVKRTRAPRPKETCVLCEEKVWIKVLTHCPKCQKYYHKRCARDYGDESVCWNCDLDGMIDDTELTEDHKEEVVSMLNAFRQSSDSETGGDDDGDNDDLEDKPESVSDIGNDGGEPVTLPVLDGRTTRSMRRWKEFLDVSTSKIDKTFNEVTNIITEALQDQARRDQYSKGFATKESVEAAMAEVMDHYAGLQEREERARAAAAVAAIAATPAPSADATEARGASATGISSTKSPSISSTGVVVPPSSTVLQAGSTG